jgi:CTP:molybdopterin cytidylyltransferase MocA
MADMIPAIVLAAGLSSRMGRAKALLPLEHETFVERIVRSFLEAGVDDVVIVLGHDADVISDALHLAKVRARIVRNPGYLSGQFSSVLAGLHAIDRPGVSAMLMTLVDVPLVSSSTVRAVVDRFRATAAPVVRPVRGAEHGHPVLITRSLFAQLRNADPAQGAKPIVRGYASATGDVPVEDDGAFLDIDTPEEYARALDELAKPSR